jgi:hypothetical protein
MSEGTIVSWDYVRKYEEMRAELDRATRLVGQSIQWQHDAEIKLLKLGTERNELLAMLKRLRAGAVPVDEVEAAIAKAESK